MPSKISRYNSLVFLFMEAFKIYYTYIYVDPPNNVQDLKNKTQVACYNLVEVFTATSIAFLNREK